MGFLSRKKQEKREMTFEELLLRARLAGGEVTREMAMQIPAVAACVLLVAGICAAVPVHLYRRRGNTAEKVEGDSRIRLLTENTGDLLTPGQMKEALVRDYLLEGRGHLYIRRRRNEAVGLHYVPAKEVSVLYNADPIMKKAEIQVGGTSYRPFDFVSVARRSEKGLTGRGIVEESADVLSAAYYTMKYELNMVQTGGNKKGFLLAENKLDAESLQALKKAWNDMYSLSTENVMVLNRGVTFKEASNTATEMQLCENKRRQAEEICNLFLVPPAFLKGGAGETERISLATDAILPVLDDIADSLCRDLLLEREKGEYFFAFDTKQLLRGDIEKLYRAYKTAIEGNFMTVDDVRRELNQPPLDFNYFKLGLQDVLYDPKTREVYTPNTNATTALGREKQKDESLHR